MAAEDRIRSVIREIAKRRRNVEASEIEWVFNQLAPYYPGETAVRNARHGKLFRIRTCRFMVSCHNPGSSQVKAYAVDDFLEAMIELGWYEE